MNTIRVVQVPVVCPQCGSESLEVFPIQEIAPDLINGRQIVLHARCHAQAWPASMVEREQIRDYLGCAVG